MVLSISQVQSIAQTVSPQGSVSGWLMRLHEASRQRTYTGTLVVTAGATMGSAKIWHVCEGGRQIERVESLTGTARTTFRRNDQVVTFNRQSKVVVVEQRESLAQFPDLLRPGGSDLDMSYRLKASDNERVAGFEADVALVIPKDTLRYGYRVWSEKKTGLVLRLQTLDVDGRVLEQVAFSDLQLDAPVNANKLAQLMTLTDGYTVEQLEVLKTSADAQGWAMHQAVAGFKSVGCYQRAAAANAQITGRGNNPMQWVFSDGLATVSLFIEPWDKRRHVHEGVTEMGGAAHTLTHRLNEWWITVVGEVPVATLNAFAQGLERKK